jgi:C1A family cysteine protease
MPIRMEEDNPGSDRQEDRGGNGPSSSGGLGGSLAGGLGGIVKMLLPMIIAKPKIMIILLIVGAIGFFAFKSCGTSGSADNGGSTDPISKISSLFNRGTKFDEKKYNETEIYEALADNKKNPLPEMVSLERFCPKRMNQGAQGSCVAWSSAYAARTILEASRTGKDPNTVRFSPSFLYNQIALEGCQGSYIKLAMEHMKDKGLVPFEKMSYNDQECSKQPQADLKTLGENYKTSGFQRLTDESKGKMYDVVAIKQNLAKGSPCVIGMMVGGSFMQAMTGKKMWIPTDEDYAQSGFGGHALCVVGYDDNMKGGALQIMNSWGEDWGDRGFFWIRYTDFKAFNKESYGLYPMGDATKKTQTTFSGNFGLELNAGKSTIALQQVQGAYFETSSSLKKGDKFKVEFTNNEECYTYVFGEETDGSNYVLFPYTPKHSPYCGITGTRLFPANFSMVPDGKSKLDKIAIIISKKPFDYAEMSKKISTASGTNYQEKVKNALGNANKANVMFNGNQTINFSTPASENDVVSFVIGIKIL